jgi:hypothetical protein
MDVAASITSSRLGVAAACYNSFARKGAKQQSYFAFGQEDAEVGHRQPRFMRRQYGLKRCILAALPTDKLPAFSPANLLTFKFMIPSKRIADPGPPKLS